MTVDIHQQAKTEAIQIVDAYFSTRQHDHDIANIKQLIYGLATIFTSPSSLKYDPLAATPPLWIARAIHERMNRPDYTILKTHREFVFAYEAYAKGLGIHDEVMQEVDRLNLQPNQSTGSPPTRG